jgi:hypothetical protein
LDWQRIDVASGASPTTAGAITIAVSSTLT